MPIAPEIIDRLLVAKGLLGRIRFLQTARPDRITLAQHILAAHDAAELALAAIARHLGKLPQSTQTYLMQYFPAIQETHPGKEVPGRDYFSQLNRVRTHIKHHGIFPDQLQWHRVGENTWTYVSRWCQDYLGFSLDDLDESALIVDSEAKRHYDAAAQAFHRENYKETLECLALATNAVFESNRALRNLKVGISNASDAIKLAAFGVHANDYLALQEFLPQLDSDNNDKLVIKWNQEKYGHPANWTPETAEFCLKTFVHVTLCIQDAEWVPGAIDFLGVYQHKVTALVDGVEIFKKSGGYRDFLGRPVPLECIVLRTLGKNESICGLVHQNKKDSSEAPNGGKTISIYSFSEDELFGEIEANKVKVTCIPRDTPFINKYFPELPEIDFEP